MSKNFKEGLIEAIKTAGQMIIDNVYDDFGGLIYAYRNQKSNR